ncbi:DUF4142 domain-containing protein [Caballeronia glathei]|uniref:DUF4142 domain-containing protein n=2 Tax=Caballeronia glathei TaxID=60547 RepID=UPI001F24E73A|nr:DUF4142 domain-containing protein [Caballeronia glathei]
MSSSREVDATRLVETHTTDKDVKNFARRMGVDHTKLTAQLKMAAPRGVTVPKDTSDTTGLDSLKGLCEKEFDTAYIQEVALAGHKKAVEVFGRQANGGQNADSKKAAQPALPPSKSICEWLRPWPRKKSHCCVTNNPGSRRKPAFTGRTAKSDTHAKSVKSAKTAPFPD